MVTDPTDRRDSEARRYLAVDSRGRLPLTFALPFHPNAQPSELLGFGNAGADESQFKPEGQEAISPGFKTVNPAVDRCFKLLPAR